MTFVVTCTGASVTISQPSPFNTSYSYALDGQAPFFTFGQFTTSITACPLVSFEIYDEVTNTLKSGWTLTTIAGGQKVTLPASLANTVVTYTFRIKITAEGG